MNTCTQDNKAGLDEKSCDSVILVKRCYDRLDCCDGDMKTMSDNSVKMYWNDFGCTEGAGILEMSADLCNDIVSAGVDSEVEEKSKTPIVVGIVFAVLFVLVFGIFACAFYKKCCCFKKKENQETPSDATAPGNV